MISARDALRLDKAKVTQQLEDEVRDVMKSLQEHIETHMTFPAPPPLTIRYDRLNQSALEILCVVMQRFGWTLAAQIAVAASRVQGAPPVPVSWILQLKPTLEAFKTVVDELKIDDAPTLM